MQSFIFIFTFLFAGSSFATEDLTEQNETVLKVARKYYESNFNGIVLKFSDYYSKQYHSSGWIKLLGSEKEFANKHREYARQRGGIKNISMSVKGSIQGLVSIDTTVLFVNKETKENNSCWLLEDGRWKMHNSCLDIALHDKPSTSEEEKEMAGELKKLLEGN